MVGSFIPIVKQFANKRPTWHVDDLGDANALLQNSSHFDKEADVLLRRGVQEVQPAWGGWLGQTKRSCKPNYETPIEGTGRTPVVAEAPCNKWFRVSADMRDC